MGLTSQWFLGLETSKIDIVDQDPPLFRDVVLHVGVD